eukprot:9645067-Lingulodinium_polyedra.AAC.1
MAAPKFVLSAILAGPSTELWGEFVWRSPVGQIFALAYAQAAFNAELANVSAIAKHNQQAFGEDLNLGCVVGVGRAR